MISLPVFKKYVSELQTILSCFVLDIEVPLLLELFDDFMDFLVLVQLVVIIFDCVDLMDSSILFLEILFELFLSIAIWNSGE